MVGAALGSTTAEPRLSRRQQEERQAAEAEQRWLDGLFYQSMIINHKVCMSVCMHAWLDHHFRPLGPSIQNNPIQPSGLPLRPRARANAPRAL